MYHRLPLMAVFLRITAYYAVAAIVLGVIVARAPWTVEYLPVGTAERLFTPPSGTGLGAAADTPITATRFAQHSTSENVVYLLLCFLAALFVAVPVAQVYRGTIKEGKEPDPCAVRLILLLPITVAGLVLIVQNSLALAFSLAGLIAGAGVRFRTRVKLLSDTLFFMVAISIGLASGVGALGIAVLMSMVFCYASLLINLQEGGAAESAGEDDKSDKAAEDTE